MPQRKFDVDRLQELDDESRFTELDPDVMWAALGCPDPAVIVDLGAGSGLFARRLATLSPSSVVYAVDVEPRAIRWIDEHSDASLGGRVVPLLAQESCVPLPDETADLVVTINLHHEFTDPTASYRELLRLSRSGGQLLVVDWAPNDTKSGPPLELRASDSQIAHALDAAGFEEIVRHEGLPHHSLVTARKPGNPTGMRAKGPDGTTGDVRRTMKAPDLDAWIEDVKAQPGAGGIGMILMHRGVVRGTTRSGEPVSAMHLTFDHERLAQVVEDARTWKGIFAVRAWANEGTLRIGDDIMSVLVAGDIRPNVFAALERLVGLIKSEVVSESEER